MRRFSKTTLMLLLCSGQAEAQINPVDGSYFGFTAGASYIPAISSFPLPIVTGLTSTATTPDLTYKLGGNFGLQLGYRFNKRARA